MSNQRTVLVESISYVGTDGESAIAFRGDKVTVHADGVAHFDWVQGDSVEGRHAASEKKAADGERAAKSRPVAEPEGKKA